LGNRQIRIREDEKVFLRNEYAGLSEPSAMASLVREYKLMRNMLKGPNTKTFWKK